MPTLNFEEIVTKISTEKGLTHEEIEKKVKEKLNQLSDLISKDGAAHIVANELGVRVYETPSSTPKKVSIKELEQGCLKDGCILKVMNCYVKDNNFGGKEVHMGSQASWIIDPAGASVVNVKATNID